MLRYGANCANDQEMRFGLAAPDLVAVDFTLQRSGVIHKNVRKNGDPYRDRGI